MGRESKAVKVLVGEFGMKNKLRWRRLANIEYNPRKPYLWDDNPHDNTIYFFTRESELSLIASKYESLYNGNIFNSGYNLSKSKVSYIYKKHKAYSTKYFEHHHKYRVKKKRGRKRRASIRSDQLKYVEEFNEKTGRVLRGE